MDISQRSRGPGHGFSASVREMLVIPRIFLSPFVATSFGLSTLLAPAARFRVGPFMAAGMEGAGSVYGFFHWFALLFFK